MTIFDALTLLIGALGVLGGLLGGLAALQNARTGRARSVVDRTQFYEQQLLQLNEENDDLTKKYLAAERENQRLRRIIERREKTP